MSHVPPSDIAFAPAVKAIQSRKGSRNSYARMEQSGGWQTTVTSELTEFGQLEANVDRAGRMSSE